MTKDQASDLRSLIDRVKACSVNYEVAEQVLKDAEAKLEQFIYTIVKEDTEHVS